MRDMGAMRSPSARIELEYKINERGLPSGALISGGIFSNMSVQLRPEFTWLSQNIKNPLREANVRASSGIKFLQTFIGTLGIQSPRLQPRLIFSFSQAKV